MKYHEECKKPQTNKPQHWERKGKFLLIKSCLKICVLENESVDQLTLFSA